MSYWEEVETLLLKNLCPDDGSALSDIGLRGDRFCPKCNKSWSAKKLQKIAEAKVEAAQRTKQLEWEQKSQETLEKAMREKEARETLEDEKRAREEKERKASRTTNQILADIEDKLESQLGRQRNFQSANRRTKQILGAKIVGEKNEDLIRTEAATMLTLLAGLFLLYRGLIDYPAGYIIALASTVGGQTNTGPLIQGTLELVGSVGMLMVTAFFGLLGFRESVRS